MPTNLAGHAPSAFYPQLLHSGGVSLATGFPVVLGNGTETPLWMDANGIGWRNAGGFLATLHNDSGADAELRFQFPGKIHPAAVAMLAADWSNATTTLDTIPAFSLDLAASALYRFELVLFISPSSVTAYPRFALAGPAAQTDFLYAVYQAPCAVAGAILGSNVRYQETRTWATEFANDQAVPAVPGVYPYLATGWVKTTSTAPATALTIQARPVTAATSITVKAGSHMTLRRMS